MAFVRESGNPGVAAAAAGMAAGLERHRQIQDAQQARLMALNELDLKNRKFNHTLDAFAKTMDIQQQHADIRRQMLGIEQENVGRRWNLEERKHAFMTEKEKTRQAERLGRMNAESALLQMQEVGDLDENKIVTILDSFKDMDPEQRALLEMRGRQLVKAQGELETKEERERHIKIASFLAERARTEEAKSSLMQQVIDAQLTGQWDEFGMVMEALYKKEQTIMEREGEISHFLKSSLKQLDSGTIGHMDDETDLSTRLAIQQLETEAQLNPMSPRVADLESHIRHLMMDPVLRKQKEKQHQTIEMLKKSQAAMIEVMPPAARSQYKGFLRKLEKGVEETYGKRAAEVQYDKQVSYINEHMQLGIDITQGAPLPWDLSLVSMREHTLEQVAMLRPQFERMSIKAQNNLAKEIFERNGIMWDPKTSPVMVTRYVMEDHRDMFGDGMDTADALLNAIDYQEENGGTEIRRKEYDEALKQVESWEKRMEERGKKGLPVLATPQHLQQRLDDAEEALKVSVYRIVDHEAKRMKRERKQELERAQTYELHRNAAQSARDHIRELKGLKNRSGVTKEQKAAYQKGIDHWQQQLNVHMAKAQEAYPKDK